MKVISTDVRINRAYESNRSKISFWANMSPDRVANLNSANPSLVYMELMDLSFDPMDIDAENNRNFLHYAFAQNSQVIIEELGFKLRMMSKEDLLKLLNQKDRTGKKPLDYCNTELRERVSKELEEIVGSSADFNQAVKANYMPVNTPATPVQNGPYVSNPAASQPAAAPGVQAAAVPEASGLTGNELAAGAVIPESDDIDFSFDEETPAAESSPAAAPQNKPDTVETKSVQEEKPEAVVDTSEDVEPVDDSDFKFDNYKNDLEEMAINGEFGNQLLDDIVGLEEIKALLKKDLIEPLKKENLSKLDNNNINIENGFLFYGPPGCGKTFLVTAIANELGLKINKLETVADLNSLKENASAQFKSKKKPTLAFIDNIDEKIDKKKIDTVADTLSDCAKNGIILLAATNKYDDLDPRYTEGNCFNQIIEIPLPNYNDRILMIESIVNKTEDNINNQISEEDIKQLAKLTSGFSTSAIMYVVQKGIKDEVLRGDGVLNIDDIKKVVEEFAKMRKIEKLTDDNPTAIYDTYIKRSAIDYPKDFSDVAGMSQLKKELTNLIVKRMEPKTRKKFEEAKMPLFNDGFLLYGPPGCGKTFITEALAGESKLPLYKIDKSVYDDSLKGQAAKNIRRIFEQLINKYEKTGEYSILFFDEADAIFPRRGTSGALNDEETNMMLQYLNNCTRRGIIPILATNFKEKIDDAIIRTGRIGTQIEIPTPDLEARKELFKLIIKDKDITKSVTDENIEELAKMLEGFVSSDITHIAKNTIDQALVNGVETLTVEDFKNAIKTFAKQRDLSADFGERDKTVQYDKFKKRARIKYPSNFSDVAGMESTKEQLRRSIVNKLKPDVQERFKNANEKLFSDGFLLYGKPGNGKTFIVEALAGETGLPLYVVSKADYDTSFKGEAIKNIEKLFRQLEEKFEKTGEYSLLFFDEAEAIFPKRGTSSNFSDEETNLMLTKLNNAPSRGIIPILATNFSEKIDPAVLRSGRIGKHIEIPSPDFEARKSMFEQKIKGKELTKHITDDDIASISRMLNGFCAADITHLASATIEKALDEGVEELTVEDFKEAIKNFSKERNLPEVNDLNITSQYDTILKRTIIKPKDPHSLNDIGGMKEVKDAMLESVIMANDPEIKAINEENGIESPNGVLLYGPPGCGKTFIMKAVAAQAQLPLYQMKMSEIGSMYANQTSSNIKAIFDQLKNKFEKTGEPSILFLDECDSFFASNNGIGGNSERNQDLNTLKEEMNNAGTNGIIIVAATNEIQNINPAILRDGRFDTKIYVGLPDKESRYDLIKKDLAKRKLTEELSQDEDVLNQLVEISEGLATVSIVKAITECIRKAIIENKGLNMKITAENLINAIKQKITKNEKLQKDIIESTLRR